MIYVIAQVILSLLFSNGLLLQHQKQKSIPYDPILKQSTFISDDSYVCELDYEIFVTKDLFIDHLQKVHPYFFDGFMMLAQDARDQYLLKQKMITNP